MNYYQKILIGIFSISLAVIPQAIVTSAKEYQIVQALSSQQINLRAKQVTVRIDGDKVGSGIIIASSDHSYTILTNWHVVKDLGNYLVQTVDGRQHEVKSDTIKQLSNVDLAIFQFTSKQNYQVAEIGNSNNLIEGQNIYFAGYPGELRTESDRFYRFFAANLVGLLTTPDANGYSLVYDGGAFPGMSGGPVLNAQGLLIGIHGESNIHAVTGAVSNYGIPSNTYQAAIANINDNNSNAAPTTSESDNNSSSPPTSTNQPETTTTEETGATPENIVETNTIQQATTDSTATETTTSESDNNSDNNNNSPTISTNQPETTTADATAAIPEAIVETNTAQQPTTDSNLSESNSVPVISSPQNQEQNSQTVTSNNLVNNITIPNNQENSNQATSPRRREVNLISPQTGIDYTNLQTLLAQKKWLEADRQTKKAINNVFETIKRKNDTSYIELTTLADRSCNDISTIDFLWRKFSGDRFGFSLQQNLWNNLHQNGNFSITVWRSFATEIGWKKGDINNSEGYILYEQLNFNPQTAPQGHLPWWFDYSTEQKNAMRQILTRCNFPDTVTINN